MAYSVGQVADFAGITVRTLHHYDEIGLLAPSVRTSVGHRRYTDVDLDRLQRILFYRELGFSLEDVAVLLDDPEVDPFEHLRRQHTLLEERIGKLQEMAAAVKHAMEARKMGIQLTPEERLEVFGSDPEQYAEEVEQRWGDTEAYRESQRRTASYTKEDWRRIEGERQANEQRFGEALAAGTPADSVAVMDLAEEHRQHIDRHFYDCSHEMQSCLGEMYVSDERFKKHYDEVRSGLAQYVHDAIKANAARHA